MTSEPIREPDPEEEKAAAPSPAAESALANDPAMAGLETTAADATAAGATTMEAPIEGDVAAASVAAATPEVTAQAPAVPKPSRRPMVLAAVRRIGAVALTLVLFGGGVLLGSATFQRTRPIPAGSEVVAINDAPPAVTQEFVAALAANDADAIRSALSEAPNKDLTDEFRRFDIKNVKAVDTLGTSIDGTRSATEILLHVEGSDGNVFEVNLVILVDGGTIEGFR